MAFFLNMWQLWGSGASMPGGWISHWQLLLARAHRLPTIVPDIRCLTGYGNFSIQKTVKYWGGGGLSSWWPGIWPRPSWMSSTQSSNRWWETPFEPASHLSSLSGHSINKTDASKWGLLCRLVISSHWLLVVWQYVWTLSFTSIHVFLDFPRFHNGILVYMTMSFIL